VIVQADSMDVGQVGFHKQKAVKKIRQVFYITFFNFRTVYRTYYLDFFVLRIHQVLFFILFQSSQAGQHNYK
jgi:hypothetical protein